MQPHVKTDQVLKISYKDVNSSMDSMRMMFDIVRLVDSEECREISVSNDGNISFGHKCYSVWKADHRCANCTSYQACHTHKKKNRTEYFEGKSFQIQSVPVELTLSDSTVYSCNMELISSSDTAPSDKHEEKPQWETSGYISTHDSLTGLLNRDGFCQEARNIISRHPNKSHIIISSDIDNFMLINSLYGKSKENDVLIGIAQILKDLCDSDAAFCRCTGSNFVICMKKTEDLPGFLKQIADETALLVKSHNFRPSMHFGIYDIDNINLPISIMCDRAYMALEAIKYDEHLTYNFFDEEMLKKIIHEQYIINEFKKNLRSGQFVIYLQPQLNREHRIEGAECLVRWILPTGDSLPPFEFIGILEQYGLIGALDEYIWELAVRQLSLWKGTEYEPLYLSVNVSPRDFFYLDITNVFVKLCKKYDIDPVKLHIEITETALADETKKNLETLRFLQKKGFIVEIDDFGKGSSSLGLLKDIQADVLKIDKLFIQKGTDEERSFVILKSVIDMSKRLKMEVIAEGVETEDQLKTLTELGCDMFQGYYFSKPIPIASFEKLAKNDEYKMIPVT